MLALPKLYYSLARHSYSSPLLTLVQYKYLTFFWRNQVLMTKLLQILRLRSGTPFDSAQEPPSAPLRDLLRPNAQDKKKAAHQTARLSLAMIIIPRIISLVKETQPKPRLLHMREKINYLLVYFKTSNFSLYTPLSVNTLATYIPSIHWLTPISA